jgi:predicted permease
MTTFSEQFRYGSRTLRRAPGFSAMTIGLLSLGIAVTSAVFSTAIAVLVRDLPIREQNRTVALWTTGADAASEVPTTLERYERFRKATKALGGVAGYAHYGSNLSPLRDIAGSLLHGRESLVTGNFFDVLGVWPVVGRMLRPSDDVPNASLVIVISQGFWRRTFGADPNVIGRRLRLLNREADATIVGVAPSGLDYPANTDYWLPIVPTKYSAVNMVGRLAPAATIEQARAEFAAFVDNDRRDFPNDAGAASMRTAGVVVQSLPEVIVGAIRQPLMIFSAAVCALLVIACVNVGNLLLVRATIREHEFGIRRALGARSVDILMQLAAETIILASAGGALGTIIAGALLRVLVAMAPPALPRVDQISLSPVAVGIAIVASMLMMFAAGVLPSFFFSRSSSATLRLDARIGTDTAGRRTLRASMVAAQIALALVLLTLSGLLLRTLSHLEHLGLGYRAEHLAIVQINAPYSKYRTTDEFNAAFDGAQQQFKAVPGVTAVSPILAWPFLGPSIFAAQFQARGQALSTASSPYVSWDAVGPDFSAAMASPILRGRGIESVDRRGAPLVAVVSQDLANLYWPGQDPIGKQLRFAATKGDTGWRTVVGVIAPLHYRALREATPTVLLSHWQEFQQGIFVVRSTRDLATILPSLRRAAGMSDRDVVLWRAQSMDDVLSGPLATPRFEAFLVAVFGVMALLLAAAGLYGITSFLLHQRTREFAIRVALGATDGDILRIAFGNVLRIGALGAGIGIVASTVATRFVAAQLFELTPYDPVSLLGAAALLWGVTTAAAFVPARRATQIDSTQALKT